MIIEILSWADDDTLDHFNGDNILSNKRIWKHRFGTVPKKQYVAYFSKLRVCADDVLISIPNHIEVLLCDNNECVTDEMIAGITSLKELNCCLCPNITPDIIAKLPLASLMIYSQNPTSQNNLMMLTWTACDRTFSKIRDIFFMFQIGIWHGIFGSILSGRKFQTFF